MTTDYSRLTGTLFASTRTLSAAVIGAGALGNEVCRILGLLGVARVLIIDPDRVEASNLTRSLLFRTDNFIGHNKAEALAKASIRLFPDTKWTHLPVAMADAGLLPLAHTGVIFSCVDSDLARIEVAASALKLDKPVADGGLGAEGDSRGRAAVYAGREHACYACQLMPQVRARLLGEHFQRRYSCTPESSGPAPPLPSTPALASIVGSLQVDRAIRHLALPPAERLSRSVELRLDSDPSLQPLRINLDPLCPFHSPPGLTIPIHSSDTTFAQVLEQAGIPEGTVVLDWPVCAGARCRACGNRWRPMRRLGLVRGGSGCPKCGVQNWIALETITGVSRESPWIDRPISLFGLPGEHLFSVVPLAGYPFKWSRLPESRRPQRQVDIAD